jgi:hypothetical protein
MAKYSDIKGFTVQTLASDTVPSQFGGGAWSSAPDMNTGRQFHASGGPSTSAKFTLDVPSKPPARIADV